MAQPDTLTAIGAHEDALRAALERRDRPQIIEIKARLAELWRQRREELAQRHINEARDWAWRVNARDWRPR